LKKISFLLLLPLLFSHFIETLDNKALSHLSGKVQPAVCVWQLTEDTESIAVVVNTPGASANRNGSEITTSYTHAGNFGCGDQTFNTVHSWTQPPAELSPGQEITFDVSASWDLNGTTSCTSLTAGVHTFIMAGTTVIKAEVNKIVLSKEPSGSVSNAGSWVVPSGSKEGETLAITANANTGISGGSVSYHYKYMCQQPTPEATLTPNPTREPFKCDGEVRDSGARFADLSGEVTIASCYDPENGSLAEMDMVIETGSIIRTEGDSIAIISFADNTSFVMKPFTTVYIEFPGTQGKLSLLAGKIWANVKYAAETGYFPVIMNQAVVGTKGTTFVVEETGQLSTLKVLEGEMYFRSLVTGESVDVITGQSVGAKSSGLTEIVAFDVEQEAAQWPETARIETQDQPPATKTKANEPPLVIWLLVLCAVSACCITFLGLIVFILLCLRKTGNR
jgi:hypothetical protein